MLVLWMCLACPALAQDPTPSTKAEPKDKAAANTAERPGPQALPVDGKAFSARLVEVDAKWNLRFALPEDGEYRTLPAADLVAWGELVEAVPRRMQLLLCLDGSRLAGELLEADETQVTIDSNIFGELKVPLRDLAAIVMRPPGNPVARESLIERLLVPAIRLREGLTGGSAESDLVMLDNGDQLSGKLLGISEVESEDPTAPARTMIRVSADGQPIAVELTRVSTLRLKSAAARSPRPEDPRPLAGSGLRAIVGFSDSSRLAVSSLIWNADECSVRPLARGGRPAPVWRAAAPKPGLIAFVQPIGGRAEYLSDLPAESYRHAPFLTLDWPYFTDRNVLGTMLSCQRRRHLKGLGLHSASVLTYAVGNHKRFDAELALDDLAGSQGSVEFRVLVDGEERCRLVLRGGVPPVPVSIDLSGAQRVTLYSGFADRGDVLDYANWLNARFVK